MIVDAIAKHMKENGIKLSSLCELTGLTKHCISSALKGKRNLSIDEYAKICAALDLPYEHFFAQSRKKPERNPRLLKRVLCSPL